MGTMLMDSTHLINSFALRVGKLNLISKSRVTGLCSYSSSKLLVNLIDFRDLSSL